MDEILNDVYKLYQKYGFLTNDIYKKEGKFSLNELRKKYGGINNAFKIINKLNSDNINLEKHYTNTEIKEKIISDVKNFFYEEGYITKDSFCNKYNIKFETINNLFNSFSNLLKVANIYEINNIKKNEKLSLSRKEYLKKSSNKNFLFTKEEAIQIGKKMFKELGYIKKDEFFIYSNYDKKTFLNMFGTFTNFLKISNLYDEMRIINNRKKGTKNNNFYNGNNKIKNFTKNEAIDMAKKILEEYNDLNKEIFLKYSNYDRRTFLKMFNNSFRDFIKEANIYDEVKEKRNIKNSAISKEECKKIIIEYFKNNDMNCEGLCKNTKISKTMIDKYWGNYSKMINDIFGLKNKECSFNKDKIENIFDDEKLNIKGISKEKLINDLYKIKVHFGTINEVLIKNEGEYALTTYYRFLGSLDEICNILGVVKNSSNGCVSNSSMYCFYLIEKVLNDKPILEKTFSWLKNDNNNALRIDAYFEKYNLAIEYNGMQHYECCEFCKTVEELNNKIKNDNIKKKLCKENGIKLVSIKYTEKLTIDNIENILIKNKIIERN